MISDTSTQDRVLAGPTHGRRRRALAVVVTVAVLGAGAWLAPTLRRAMTAEPSVRADKLTIATVERRPFVRDIAAEGKVVAAVSPTVYAPSAGAVALQAHAGDRVTKGQVLATIESPELAARLAQELSNADAMQSDVLRAQVESRQQRSSLRGALENAAVDRRTAENDLERQQKAFAAGAVAGMQVDRARDALEKARIADDHARANLGIKDDSLKLDVQAKQLAHQRQLLLVKDLQRQVAALAVRSPVDGQIGQLFVSAGASVARDAQLMSVVDLSALEVQMQVPESAARELAIGMPGDITGSGGAWKGKVSAISPEVVGNEVATRLRFDGAPPAALRQNQRLSVRVLIDNRADALVVRRGPFVDELGGTAAYVVSGGRAVKRPVRLGARGVDSVEILEGLSAGAQVVIAGADAFGGAPQVRIDN